jgi:hypothetical protein
MVSSHPDSNPKASTSHSSARHMPACPPLKNPATQDVFQSIVKGRKSWKSLKGGEIVWPPELEAALIEGKRHHVARAPQLTVVGTPRRFQVSRITSQMTREKHVSSDAFLCETDSSRTGFLKRRASDAPPNRWAVVCSSSEIRAVGRNVSVSTMVDRIRAVIRVIVS